MAQLLSLEQVCDTLGVSAEDVQKMVSDGRLREVRDAGKRFYRPEDVERIRGKEGSSIVDLNAVDEPRLDDNDSFASALSSLADSSSSLSILDDTGAGAAPGEIAGTGSSISLSSSDIELDGIPENLPAKPAAKPAAKAPPPAKKTPADDLSSEIGLLSDDDLHGDKADLKSAEESADLGLSGSDVIRLDGVEEAPAPKKGPDAKQKAKEDTRITSSGISVFDDDELEVDADPMGKTHVAPAVEDFDAVGSGSGLLDLTRESDDTSLGAELLDVISPTEAAETEAETAVADDAVVAQVTEDSAGDTGYGEAAAATAVAAPAVRRAVGAMAGATTLNVSMFLGLLGLTVIGFATAGQLVGVWPDSLLGLVSRDIPHMATFVGLIVIAGALGIVSIVQDRK